MSTATTIVTILLAALFLFAGGGKLAGVKQQVEARDHFGISASSWRVIGALEVAGAVGVLVGLLAVRFLGVAAAVGLVLVGIGAIATHVRAGDQPREAVPAVIALALAAATLVLQAATA